MMLSKTPIKFTVMEYAPLERFSRGEIRFMRLPSQCEQLRMLSRIKSRKLFWTTVVLPIESRFGTRAPSAVRMVEGLANQRGETIVSHGPAAANALGLTTQVPMRAIHLTSGPNRRLKLGAQMVELRYAPAWQLIFPGRAAGEVVRALAWLGPEKAGKAILKLRAKLTPSELKDVASARSRLPTWMAHEISALLTHD